MVGVEVSGSFGTSFVEVLLSGVWITVQLLLVTVTTGSTRVPGAYVWDPALDELVQIVDLQFKAWSQPNPVLRRLCSIG